MCSPNFFSHNHDKTLDHLTPFFNPVVALLVTVGARRKIPLQVFKISWHYEKWRRKQTLTQTLKRWMLKTWNLKCKGTPIYIKQRSKKLNATDYRRSLTISTRLVNSYSTRKCDNCKGANFSHLSKNLLDLKCNCAFQATTKRQYVFPTRLFKKNIPLFHHLGRHPKELGSTRND